MIGRSVTLKCRWDLFTFCSGKLACWYTPLRWRDDSLTKWQDRNVIDKCIHLATVVNEIRMLWANWFVSKTSSYCFHRWRPDCSKEYGFRLGIRLRSALGLALGFHSGLWLEAVGTGSIIFTGRISAAGTVYTRRSSNLLQYNLLI